MQNLLQWIQDLGVYPLACLILLGILIFVHELGHFLVARWCGVRVEVFSLGFGRKIWTKVIGDTTYAISLIPLGGYVKMYGEQPGETVPEELKAVSFTHKTVWQRIAIVLAGPLMNLFFAALVFSVVAGLGTEMRAPVLGDIESGTAAAEAGFRSGDRIVSIDGRPVTTFDDVALAMDESIGGKLSFKVRREDGTESDIAAPIHSAPNMNPLSLRETVGEIQGLSTLSRAPVVGVPKESPLWAAGLRSGDMILSVGDRKISTFRELSPAFAATSSPVVIEVQRGDGRSAEKFTVTVASAAGGFEGLRLESAEMYLSHVVPGSPAAKAGLEKGDRFVALNGKPAMSWQDVLEAIKGYKGEGGIKVDFTREGENKSAVLEPQMTSQVTATGSEDRRYTVGIVTSILGSAPETVTVSAANPLAAVGDGVKMSYEWSMITVMSFVRLFQGDISHKTVGGLLSIGQAAGETMKLGFNKFLTMMAIISINLFILNLLPVPVLDGGHLVFYTIEAIKGSPLSIRKIEFAQQIGLMLLMGLMVFALYNDVTRLFFSRL